MRWIFKGSLALEAEIFFLYFHHAAIRVMPHNSLDIANFKEFPQPIKRAWRIGSEPVRAVRNKHMLHIALWISLYFWTE